MLAPRVYSGGMELYTGDDDRTEADCRMYVSQRRVHLSCGVVVNLTYHLVTAVKLTSYHSEITVHNLNTHCKLRSVGSQQEHLSLP